MKKKTIKENSTKPVWGGKIGLLRIKNRHLNLKIQHTCCILQQENTCLYIQGNRSCLRKPETDMYFYTRSSLWVIHSWFNSSASVLTNLGEKDSAKLVSVIKNLLYKAFLLWHFWKIDQPRQGVSQKIKTDVFLKLGS